MPAHPERAARLRRSTPVQRPREARSLAITSPQGGPDRRAARRRAGEPAVVGRSGGGRRLGDLVTVADEALERAARRLNAVGAS